MIVPLRISYSATPLREPAAWFIAGCSAADWLDELTAWNVKLSAARLHVVPSSAADAAPCGVLVLGVSPPQAHPAPHVFPYGVLAGHLYLPINAMLEPPASDAELRELLADDTTYVWRPQTGLVASTAADALRVSDLLAAPTPETQPWDRAVAGVALNARLLSIEPELTLRAEDVLNEGRGDIGSRPLRLEDLPRPENEPSQNPLSGAGRALESGLAKAIQWLMKQVPHTGQHRTWVNDLEDWAAGKLHRISESLTASQHRELLRLLNLLANEPDEGLRFALPIGGDAHRGLAPPSGRLGQRNVDFNLNQLGGGGPADFWDVPSDYQQQLVTRYRELAAREIALGRHRRAAYIFATLLGDVRSAAATLADGAHFREAAALYEERLHQPVEAARCLQRGGLWAEAIAIYDRLGHHEVVGDLYRQLDQPEEATAAWRRAVELHLKGADVLSAARLLENKLACPEEACEHLLAAWPRAKQAEACLNEAFALLARRAWHERAAKLVADLPGRSALVNMNVKLSAPLVETLAAQAASYPDATVRERAADQSRVVAADFLGSKDVVQAERIVQAVGRLVPQDRLLPRDAQRFLQQLRKAQAIRPVAPRTKVTLVLSRKTQLPPVANRQAAVSTEHYLFAAGYQDRELKIARLFWETGDIDNPLLGPFRIEPSQVGEPILLAADPFGTAPVVLAIAGCSPLPGHFRFSPTDSSLPILAGSHRGVTARSVAVQYTDRETLHVADFAADNSLVINAYVSHSIEMVGLLSLDVSRWVTDPRELCIPLPMLIREGTVALGIQRHLCFVGRGQATTSLELPSPIRSVIGSAPHTRTRIAAAMEEGAVMVWGDTADAPHAPFVIDMERPRIVLTRGGWLVAASKQQIEVYSTRDGQLKLHARAPGTGSEPLAALTTGHTNQFALVLADGWVLVYDVPA